MVISVVCVLQRDLAMVEEEKILLEERVEELTLQLEKARDKVRKCPMTCGKRHTCVAHHAVGLGIYQSVFVCTAVQYFLVIG